MQDDVVAFISFRLQMFNIVNLYFRPPPHSTLMRAIEVKPFPSQLPIAELGTLEVLLIPGMTWI